MKSFKELFDENGNYITDSKYTEILRLKGMLDEAKIPNEFHKFMDGWQVVYQSDDSHRIMDAVEHYGSYGQENNLLEIMGLLTPEEDEYDSVAGYLTAQNVFDRIKKHYEEHKGESHEH